MAEKEKFEKLAVVGERELVLGFKLIGVRDVFIQHGSEAAGTVLSLIERKNHNLLIVSEGVKASMDSSLIRIAETSIAPLVVFVPLPGVSTEEESVEELAKRVLGVDINALGVKK